MEILKKKEFWYGVAVGAVLILLYGYYTADTPAATTTTAAT